MATIRWCSIFPKWDSYQPLHVVPCLCQQLQFSRPLHLQKALQRPLLGRQGRPGILTVGVMGRLQGINMGKKPCHMWIYGRFHHEKWQTCGDMMEHVDFMGGHRPPFSSSFLATMPSLKSDQKMLQIRSIMVDGAYRSCDSQAEKTIQSSHASGFPALDVERSGKLQMICHSNRNSICNAITHQKR